MSNPVFRVSEAFFTSEIVMHLIELLFLILISIQYNAIKHCK